ncbi:MAG: hypothetical protein HKM24_02945 [Gammaproteobacteria bacterium]|nr:hypothetical protein [Gammaproteobacteria bacterium]
MSNGAKKLVHGLLLIILVVVAVRYVDFSVVSRISPFSVAAVWLVVLIANIARFFTIRLAMLRHDISLHTREWLGLGVYSALLNLVLPLRAGLSVKAVYLKRKYGFNYSKLIGVQGAIGLLQFYVLISLALLLGLTSRLMNNLTALILLLVVVFAMLAPYFFSSINLTKQTKIAQALQNAFNTFLHLAKNTRFMFDVLLNMIVILFFTGLAVYFAFFGLGVSISLPDALLISVIVSLLSVINLTPGNLGIHEFAVAFLGQALGGDFDTGFVAMLVVRTMSVLGFFVLSPIGLKLKSSATENDL